MPFFRDFSNIGDIVINALFRLIPALFCITIHELAHGVAAYKLGDNTAKDMGRLTLNPVKHIDPIGLLMMLVIGFGWAKPVPVNMHNFKHPKWFMAVTALAGPVSNILLAVFVIFIFGLFAAAFGVIYEASMGMYLLTTGASEIAFRIFSTTIFLSIALAVFNMLPIPPLDGSKVVFSLLPEEQYYKLMKYERYGIILLLVFINSSLIFGVDLFYNTVVTFTLTIESYLREIFVIAYNLVN